MSNDPKKRGLGRGLAALLANTSGEPPAGAGPEGGQPAGQSSGSPTPHLVDLDALAPNPHQPRGQFDVDSLAELAESIRVHGIIQPLVVTPAPGQEGRYWIIAGERRWRAARQAGLTSAPVIVRGASAQALTELALVENIQRDDLNAVEEARAYQALMDNYGLTQVEVAERVGKSRPAVANAVRLLGLPPAAQQAIVEGRIAAGHARALLALPDAASTAAVLDEVERGGLSVRQTEALVKRWLEEQAAVAPADAPPARPAPDPQLLAHLGHLEDRFRSALGTKVNLNRNDDGSGRLVVHFYSDDDLEAIYRLVAGEDEAP
jgi:ParB family chromosome partitioning protein